MKFSEYRSKQIGVRNAKIMAGADYIIEEMERVLKINNIKIPDITKRETDKSVDLYYTSIEDMKVHVKKLLNDLTFEMNRYKSVSERENQ